MTRLVSPGFRRRLLQRVGITALPVCPLCRRETPLAQWTALACCRDCELALLEYERDTVPPVCDPQALGGTDPFLPEDEDS